MVIRLTTAGSTVATRRWGAPAIVTLGGAGRPDGADRRRRGETGAPAAPVEATAPRDAGEPIMAIVSIKSQQVTFYDADGWILRAPVSTGTTGRETPAGVFALIEKDKDHHSSLYDDAWMPNMQRITWNGIALHGGPLPGYAASHGCVRMPFGFAEKLFEKTRIGMRVIISPNDAEPVEFSHPALFVPKAEAIAAAPAKAEALAREAAEAAKAADEAKKAAATAAREAASLTASLRKLEGSRPAPTPSSPTPTRRSPPPRRTRPRRGPRTSSRRPPPRPRTLGTQLDTAKADAKSKLDAAAAAKDAVKAAETRKADTAKAASEAKLALEPASIYISRATQKLYVRRNTHKPAPDGGGEVFDATIEVPVTIRNPDKPIGTHVFTAMARNDAGLRWTAVTIDNGDDARDALDRITIPQDVLDRIAPTALPRSSIVISDEPLSTETNYRTEFVAVLSNQPQGGFITRKPTVDVLFGRGGFFSGWFFRKCQTKPPPKLAIKLATKTATKTATQPAIHAGAAASPHLRCSNSPISRCSRAGGETRPARASGNFGLKDLASIGYGGEVRQFRIFRLRPATDGWIDEAGRNQVSRWGNARQRNGAGCSA